MPKLLEFSNEFREKNISRKIYHAGDFYQSGHSRAISDDKTPEWGKGEVNGRVGGWTDIQTRNHLKSKNFYNSTNLYGVQDE